MFLHDARVHERIYRGSNLDLLVLGREEARTVTPHEPYAVISITDPEREEAILAESPLRRAILRLRFHDIDGGRVVSPPSGVSPTKTALTASDAQSILAFIRTHL